MMKKKKVLWLAPLLAMLFVVGFAVQGAMANEFATYTPQWAAPLWSIYTQ